MITKYKLQLEIVIDEMLEERVKRAARRAYVERGIASEGSGEEAREISAEEFIDDVQKALIELVEDNSQLSATGVEIRTIRCDAGVPIRAA